MNSGLATGDALLIDGAKGFFDSQFADPAVHTNEAIDDRLLWTPSMYFRATHHLVVAAEVSETPYPAILRLRHAEVMAFQEPIAVYCVCPEDVYLRKESQPDVRLLRAHGYGLITVDAEGNATKRHGCIPLIQFITDTDFQQQIDGLPKKWRARLSESYEKYLVNAVSGVQDVSEVLEGLALSAAKGAARKRWATASLASQGLADMLDGLSGIPECKSARAAIGGVRSYVKQYRNPSHHYPRNKKEAVKKYRGAQHGFRDGIRQIHSFRAAMAGIGLNLSL